MKKEVINAPYIFAHWAISLIIGSFAFCMIETDFEPFFALVIYGAIVSVFLLIPLFVILFLSKNDKRLIHLFASIIIIALVFLWPNRPEESYKIGAILILTAIGTSFILRNQFVPEEKVINENILDDTLF